MAVLLCLALCGLAFSAAGVARQLLPRQFSAVQQRQIMAWEMSRRWRALSAGQLFPAEVDYKVPAQALDASQGLPLAARRLGIAPQATCATGVSATGARALAARDCTALLRATYIDASGSMLVTLGIAVLPGSAAATEAARQLSAQHGLTAAVRAFAVARTPAAGFRDSQRQLSVAIAAGPYVIMATAGFTDGRPHVQLSTDYYYDQEMTSLADAMAAAAATRIGTRPPVPSCPGAPGC